MNFFNRLGRLVRQKRSAKPADLALFIARWGAFVAQKTVLDYCAVKLGLNWEQARREPAFAAALRDCRWRVYFATQGDVAALVEARLRPHARGAEGRLADRVAAMAEEALAATEPPEHLRGEAQAAAAGYRSTLARLQMAREHGATTLPLQAGPILLETLPIHPDLRRGEAVSILGALRMHVVSADQELERRFDLAALASALLAAEGER
ncbi:hypothetical protein [Elioraea thermophila]|uniref:hypothetical protein n=1 Tax=Elioraea thermophila TaxID=2185104 RepID=UPI0018E4EBEC|nr:hypothetical protein [Elioraea thermophila]